MQLMHEQGSGVIVLINRQLSDSFSKVVSAREKGRIASESGIHELRDYGIGAQVLAELGVHEMILLSNNPQTPIALAGYGLSIVGQQPVPQFRCA